MDTVSNLTINGETREIVDNQSRNDIAELQQTINELQQRIDKLERNVAYIAEQEDITLPQ